MRRITCLLLALALLLPLAACGNRAADDPQPTPPVESDLPGPTEEPTQDPDKGSIVTYANVGGGWQMLSYIDASGEELLTGDVDLSQWLSEAQLSAIPEIKDLPKYRYGSYWIAGNAPWEYFSDPLSVRAYDLDTQPENDAWTAYFTGKLAEFDYDGPLCIAGSTSFSPAAGREIAIVTASNIIREVYPYLVMPMPSNDVPLLYTLTAVFEEGKEPQLLFERHFDISKDMATAERMGISYVNWDPVNADVTQFLAGVQYDAEGNPAIFPVCCDQDGFLTLRGYGYFPKFLFCDLDGDLRNELVQSAFSPYAPADSCIIYELGDTLEQVATIR